jgi:hypothetical protein
MLCHEISSLLEGLMPPLASLRLARGLDAPSGESEPRSRPPKTHDAAPTPPTGVLNALVRRRCPGQRRIPTTPVP